MSMSLKAREAGSRLYDYLPYDKRPKIPWPNGARVAFWVAPNIEFYELNPPKNPTRSAWPRPVPDVLDYSYRDYGNRAGFQRMMEAMDRCGVRGSVSLNVARVRAPSGDHRGLRQARLGVLLARHLQHALHVQHERGAGARADPGLDRHHQASTPARSSTAGSRRRSPTPSARCDLVAEMGLHLRLRPVPRRPARCRSRCSKGRLTSIPYSLEMNDVIAFSVNSVTPRHYGEIIKRQFDRLYAEGEESGTVMCIPLHPYLIGQPYRIKAFEEALAYITGHDKVWLATGREIAQHFLAHHYDAFAAAVSRRGERGRGGAHDDARRLSPLSDAAPWHGP